MISFDCHAHVYETVTAVRTARYVPDRPAPLADWLVLQAEHGVAGGVIVQVSFLGFDNSQMLAVLADLDRTRFCGIAVTPLSATDDQLAHLAERGVRGLRWNLVSGAALPDPADPKVRRFLDRMRAHGLHVEIQLESPRLAALLPSLLPAAGTLVIDHVGLPALRDAGEEPWLRALAGMRDRDGLHVKLSAPYRCAFDPRGHIERLFALLPAERFLWGSDWPHTRHEAEATYDGLRLWLDERIDDTAAVETLYGLSGAA